MIDREEAVSIWSRNLKRVIKGSDFDQKNLADLISKSQNTLTSYVQGKSVPDVVTAYQLAQQLGTSIEALMSYEELAERLPVKTTAVPIYDVTLGAGEYSGTAENALIVGHMNFADVWLRHIGVEPDLAFLAQVLGQSMTKLMNDGDLVLGEKVPTLDRHGIYAVWLDGDLLVKHVQRDGQTIRLLSENEKYPPIEVREPERFRIEGRVVRRVTGVD